MSSTPCSTETKDENFGIRRVPLLFRQDGSTAYVTSRPRLLACYRAAKEGRSIRTGIWHDPGWNPDRFLSWFRLSLDQKITSEGRRYRKLDAQYQSDLRHDARIINDYARRIRWTGRNLLRNADMITQYPHVNNQPFVDP